MRPDPARAVTPVVSAEGSPDLAAGHGVRHARNLVVLRAGDASLHRDWLAGAARDFDLFISYYGDQQGRYRRDADHYECRRGPKWPCIVELLRENAELVSAYDSVWFPDDDLAADTDVLNRMFAFFHAYQLHLAQPALTRDSYVTWSTLRQDPSCHLRYTGFVEVMAPIFSREALSVCGPSFKESASGWGLDWLWPGLCRAAGLDRIAVIDGAPVRHTRPVGGELYRRNGALTPRDDAARVIRQHGLSEVRAVAKYSIERRVVCVPLRRSERLIYWLKRLNGRRKHLLGR